MRVVFKVNHILRETFDLIFVENKKIENCGHIAKNVGSATYCMKYLLIFQLFLDKLYQAL